MKQTESAIYHSGRPACNSGPGPTVSVPDSRITELVRTTRPLLPSDSVSRAVGLLRASGGSAAPVVSGMQVVGIVRESDLLPLLAASANGNGPDVDSLPPVGQVMSPPEGFLRADSTIREAADAFARSGAEMLPVVTDYGAYAGYLLRSDITAALSNAIRPPVVGGLATPLGVHLTCGSQRGGVGDGALVLLGVMFGLLNILGFAIAGGIAWAAQHWFGQPLYAALLSEPAPRWNVYDAIAYLALLAPVVTLLLGVRLLPVAGYHAAEHQTVHAIERGEPLDLETLRRMPRVHPRCGTNLAAAASIFIVMVTAYPGPLAVFAGIMVVLLGWRSIGAWLQQHVTTKPASRKQIESGIEAGKELLARYREEVLGAREPGRRIWNLGFAQIGAGLAATLLAADAVVRLAGWRIPFF